MKRQLGNRGAGSSAVFAVVFTAMLLYVTVITVGKIDVVGGSMFATTSATGMLMANNSQLVFSGLNIAAVGILVLAAVMILSYLGVGWGRK
jgi:hypothetical protein